MPVTGIDHINIRTTDIAASARFFVEVFDFEFRGGQPGSGQQPNWLHDKTGRPIIHLRSLEPGSPSTGPIDHVALVCEGKSQILSRLAARGIHCAITENAVPGRTIVFIRDPHGIALELNFFGE